jgi:hypothetical protein
MMLPLDKTSCRPKFIAGQCTCGSIDSDKGKFFVFFYFSFVTGR